MKKSIVVALLLSLSLALFAQVSTNPADNFYAQVERWEVMGLIEKQPSLRPYALPVVEKILTAVIESDSEADAEVAKSIYKETFSRPWELKLDATAYGKKGEDGLSKRGLAKYGVEGDVDFNNHISAGYQLDFLTDVFPETNVLPHNRYFSYFMADGRGSKLRNYMEVDGNLAFNYGNFYFQTGINHNSFGPFYADSLVLSSNSKHTANFTMTYAGKNWNYTEAMFALSATSTAEALAENPSKYPNKWLMLHDIDWNINDKLSLSFYETVIYGKRWDPSYLIPMLYMVTQGVTGYGDDNLFMGGSLVYRPVAGLSLLGDFYLDDVGFTGIREYHDMKIHCAGSLGVKYVPQKLTAIQMIKADYTLVTPFMYSHDQDNSTNHALDLNGINYQMYTTAGRPLGSSLQPNSDRIALSSSFKPVTGLTIDVGGSFSRHGNVTESLSRNEMLSLLASPAGYYSTDGSITQHTSYGKNGNTENDGALPSANHRSMILTQATKEYTIQADMKVGYDFPETKAGRFGVSLGYTFEYIKNSGVGNNMLPGGTIFYNSADGKYYEKSDYSGAAYTDKELDVAISDAIRDWKKQLKNVTNHYVTLNFKYTF